jgi:hypothetical protein
MRQSGFRAWKALGGLAAVALLSVGCGKLPMSGGRHPDDPPQGLFANEVHHVPSGFYQQFQYSPDRGYNGTIQSLGSSIDPRTPEKQGQSGRSLLLDVTGRPAPSTSETELGIGGSGLGAGGNPQGPSDMGWRARRAYEVGPASDFGPYGQGQTQ